MEPFFDGGLFELFIAIGVGYSLNFIFKRKYLLVIYSIISIATPILLLFTNKSEMFIWLVSISIFNSTLLIIFLWKQRLSNPNKSLFETEKLLEKFFLKRKLKHSFKHPTSTYIKKEDTN
jgi:hypothetical protein